MTVSLVVPFPGVSAGSTPIAAIKPRRIVVIHNPTAGGGRRRLFGQTLAALAARGDVEVTVRATSGPGDAERIAAETMSEDVDALVVAGGDGTINEAINGLIRRQEGGGAAIPLGIVPLGTANVLANELALPRDAAGWAAVLAEGVARPIHVGVANGRCFAMMVGAGLDARVVAHLDGRLKKLIGKGAYVIGTLAELVSRRPRRYRVTVDGETSEVASVVVANGHYYGGRFVCAAEARLTDPRLFVCLFPGQGRWNALRYVWGVTLGRLKYFHDVRILPASRASILGLDPEEGVQGDGDIIARLPVDIAVSPRQLPVLVAA